MSGDVTNPVEDIVNDGALKLNGFLVSLIRTYAPKVVVAVVTWIAVTFGFEVSAETAVLVTVAVIGFLEALWYFIARLFEQWGAKKNLPWLVKIGGIMLFVPKPPAYTPNQAARLIAKSKTE